MKQFSVKGKFVVEFSGVVDAEDRVQAEEKVARTYRRVLSDTVNVTGRPYDVKIKEIENEQSKIQQ